MMRRRPAPMARRMPISRCFCTTLTTSTLEMPNATMITTKLRIRLFDTVWLLSALSRPELVCIQLSTVRPVCARRVSAAASAPNRSRTVRSMLETPPGRSSSDWASFKVTKTQRRFRSRLPMSNRPVMSSVSLRPVALVTRSLSPTVRPRSLARSVPISAPVPATSKRPRVMKSSMRTTRRYCSGCTPSSTTLLLLLPRAAKAGPLTTGDTASTPGVAAASAAMRSHWSTERRRCSRGCTSAATAWSARGVTTRCVASSSGLITTWACEPSTLSMMVPCSWLMSCVRKMITATPPVTPARISALCMRPSRRKRSATSSSKGIQRACELRAGRVRWKLNFMKRRPVFRFSAR
jgi:hypothetical protein